MVAAGRSPHIVYVLGTRPEVIRSAAILRRWRSCHDVRVTVVHTGQHFDWNMSGGFFDALGLDAPDHFLEVGGRSRAEQIGRVTEGVAALLTRGDASCVCVFGDTNSSLGGALGGVAAGVPVVHIEAGARSYDMSMPEEVNRRLIDHCSDFLCAVSSACAHNLATEAVRGQVSQTGDPLLDVFLTHRAALSTELPVPVNKRDRTCLLTLHRQALVDDPAALVAQLDVINHIAGEAQLRVVFPVHPRTARALAETAPRRLSQIDLCEPLLYGALLERLCRARLVITDSGGLQKEAFWARTPCVTVRPNTEWTETLSLGANVLAMSTGVAAASRQMLDVDLTALSDARDPYGPPGASERIADAVATRYA